ncbi:MAG TPA: Dabb family protein [Propionibacteriaceae bacterium]|nr:Dabb family protein [Propionibacteriaceae bacterium]
MPIQHTVVFRLAHEPGSDAEARFLDDASTTLAAIPGVRDFAVNRQVGTKNDLAWQFSMVFADQDAYESYNHHPAHVAFVRDRWQSEVAAFEEYDFIPR